jgi:simple sugar transport system ATP-binding protein
MTVAENIVLAAEPRKGPLLDRNAARERVREISARYGLRVDPDAVVEDITVGAQQRVEILRALYRGAEILVLDEPTAVLTAQETAELFDVLRELRSQGVAIIFISHKLNEVLEIADRISVLQRGRKVATLDAAGATEAELARLMVGREVLFRVEKQERSPGQPMLELTDVHAADDRGLPALRGVSLTVRGGEVVGIAGVDGNGQSELVECVTGLRAPTAGSIKVSGREIGGRDVLHALDAGVGHIPEDRHRRGLILDFDLAENLALREYRRPPLARRGLLSPKRMRAHAEPLLKVFDVRGGTPETPARALSGGNQQKVVVARELEEDPRVLVAAQPTRGLDVGAIEFVHSKLLEQRDKGRAVLLISLELEELRNVADRLLVIADGRIVGEFPPDASDEQLGLAMTGGSVE